MPLKPRFLYLTWDTISSLCFSFFNGLELLHIVGTYEKAEEEEGEVYEVVNIKTLKQATPNLRIINLYGITFLDDTHIEAFSSNCIQLQVTKMTCYKFLGRVQELMLCLQQSDKSMHYLKRFRFFA